MKWLRLSAKEGSVNGLLTLGGYYYDSNIVAKDEAVGIKLYELAAEKGHPIAMNRLGSHYFQNENYNEAIKWHQLAAEKGLAESMVQLSYCYKKGLGVPQDLSKAKLWKDLSRTF